MRRRMAVLVHGCVALLLVTGFLNFFILVVKPRVAPMPYHALFGLKLFGALFVFFVAIALSGSSPAFATMRARRQRWLSILLIVAGGIILLSGILSQVRGRKSADARMRLQEVPASLLTLNRTELHHLIFPSDMGTGMKAEAFSPGKELC